MHVRRSQGRKGNLSIENLGGDEKTEESSMLVSKKLGQGKEGGEGPAEKKNQHAGPGSRKTGGWEAITSYVEKEKRTLESRYVDTLSGE